MGGAFGGIAHLLEHMIFHGISSQDRNLLSYFNAWTSDTNTQFMFSSTNKNFLQSFALFWRALANFTKYDYKEVSSEIASIQAEFMINLENDYWIERYLLSENLDKKSHPLHRFKTGSTKSLLQPLVQDQVYQFYKNYYSTSNLIVVAVVDVDYELSKRNSKIQKTLNIVTPPKLSPLQTQKKFTKLHDDLKKIMGSKTLSMKTGPTTLTSYGVPYKKNPIVLFLNTNGDPKINLSFQVDHLGKSDLEIGKNLTLVCFYLKNLLVQKLKWDLGHAIEVQARFEQERTYSFLNVDVTLSEMGRKYANGIVYSVLGAIREVRDTYAVEIEYFEEFQRLSRMEFWLTPKPESSLVLTQSIADRIDRVGVNGAITDLTVFGDSDSDSKKTQENIFKWLDVENMRVVVFEDFGVEATAKTVDMYDPIDLSSSFESLLGKPTSFDDQSRGSNVVLDQWSSDYKAFYHFQTVEDSALIKKWKDAARAVKFDLYQKNQYILSDKFMQSIKNRYTTIFLSGNPRGLG
jgi:secreted Zn-dependent insulinase-like peptidase